MKYDAGMTNPIAATMRRARLEKRLSGAALGELVGHSQAFVSRFESGDRDTKLGDVMAMAKALDLELVVRPVGEPDMTDDDRGLVEAFARLLRLCDDEQREIYALEFELREKMLKRRQADKQ